MTPIAFITGLGAIVAGVAMIYIPAALIIGGLGLVGLAILSNEPRDKGQS